MGPISIYIHLPYCVKKCPYCDFNSHGVGTKGLSAELEERYLSALLAEAAHFADQPFFVNRSARTVFFGGGTPSLFSASAIERLLAELDRLFPFEHGAEVTLEANPGTLQEDLGRKKLTAFRKGGVNRISLGCQSFDLKKLSFLGRIHCADDTRKAVENIRAAGFSNLSLDLIYGVKNETPGGWISELREAASLGPEHLSAYCLTVEPNTEFGARSARGEVLDQPDDMQAELYEAGVSELRRNGFEQYEVSNFAKPAMRCEHNWRYWHGSDYLGLGAGAHSFARLAEPAAFGRRWANKRNPGLYVSEALAEGRAIDFEETLTRDLAEIEFLYLRLRCPEGFTEDDYRNEFGISFAQGRASGLKTLLAEGLLEIPNGQVRLTPKGMLVMDSVLGSLIIF